ncbi:MAG: nucleotidyltransferase family protein [Alphaproteobacteria bacterium]|jgi:hypothetical protein|nr:nucleotidyltransferase family protein [Alphaproteobacteria bacterium]
MNSSTDDAVDFVLDLIRADGWRLSVLARVHDLGLPDCWVGAGFVRNLVWDRLQGHARATPPADIDVLYFDAADPRPEAEQAIERALRRAAPELPWEVRNQARMHLRNGDPAYRDTTDALRHWLETATAVAVRLDAEDRLHLAAPHGLDDLLALRLRPTPAGRRRPEQYRGRVAAKDWQGLWPKLELVMPEED